MFEEKANAELYETSCLPLAAYLYLERFKLWSVENDKKKNRKIFIFERDEGLDQRLELYWRKEARVEPESFFFALKALKARLYDQSN